MSKKEVLVVDNYDSFTWNLVHYLEEIGAKTRVIRNDDCSVNEVLASAPDGIVLSPGPCTPNEAGICVELVQNAPADMPILGVCLGHQSIGQAFGGKIVPAKRIMHGKTSNITHNERDLFYSIAQNFTATRYHSLVIDEQSLPDCLLVTARSDDTDSEIMGIRHKEYNLFGVQFHPESILTQSGHKLLENFLNV